MSPSRNAKRRADLLEERDALLRSIEDLERDRAAGDLEPDAYDDLHSTYVAPRTAEVLRALGELGDPSGDETAAPGRTTFRRLLGRRRVRRVFGIGATFCVIGTIALVALLLAGVRLPGQNETGGVVIPKDQQVSQYLAEASADGSAGDVDDAIKLYDAVLADQPNEPVALTYKAWLERLSGLDSESLTLTEEGDHGLAEAAQVAPSYADTRGLYAIALLEDGGGKENSQALSELRAFARVATKTNPVLVANGPTMAEAFISAKAAVPSLFEPYVGGAKTSATGPTGA